jgi:hypothetical protein
MKAWITVGFVGLLAGCVSSSNKLDRALRPFVGKEIAVLSAVFGDPEIVQMGGVDTRYTWTVDNRFVITQPRLATSPNDLSRMPVFPAPQVTQDVAVHYLCNLQVVTDQAGIIKTFHTNGNEGCQRFVTALDPRSL